MLFKLLVALFAASAGAVQAEDEITVCGIKWEDGILTRSVEKRENVCYEDLHKNALFTDFSSYDLGHDPERCEGINYFQKVAWKDKLGYLVEEGKRVSEITQVRDCNRSSMRKAVIPFVKEAFVRDKDWRVQYESLRSAGFEQSLLRNFYYTCLNHGLAPLLTFNEIGNEVKIVVVFTVIANLDLGDYSKMSLTFEDERKVACIRRTYASVGENPRNCRLIDYDLIASSIFPESYDKYQSLQATRDVSVPEDVFKYVPNMRKVFEFVQNKLEIEDVLERINERSSRKRVRGE